MYGRSNALSSYGRVANAEANPIQQIVLLYEGAIKFLRMASASIEANDIAAKAEQTDRALQIINYLQSVLDFEHGGDVSVSLDALYMSVTMIIINASAKLDAAEMLRAADLLAPVRDAWATNARANAATAAGNYSAINPLPHAAAESHRIAVTL
jgi:flagellar secretion chaperone FliS